MKIGLITDTHYNFRKANKPFHEYFAKFYDEIFFPTLKKNKIKTVIHLGDAFDSRKGVDYWALDWAKENVYDKFQDLGITVYNIVGNHDAYYKNSNEINSIDTLLQQYYNVVRVSKPTEYTIEGMDKKVFHKFDRVYSGHYHTRSDDGKIFYLGNPYQMFWSDLDDKRGFHIFDTDDYKLDYYQNPYTMFERVYYENNNPKEFDASYLTDKMVKIVVRQRDDYKLFDKFVDAIVKVNPLELKIIENVDVYDEDVNCDEIPTEDTLSILDKYVEESEFELDKNTIKKLLREFYKEALEVE